MSSDVYHETMAALRETFREKLAERVSEIELAISSALSADQSEVSNALNMCHSLSHKLAGAAGTFGYASVSKHARELEQGIVDCLDIKNAQDAPDPGKLDVLLLALKNSVLENTAAEIFSPTDWRIGKMEFSAEGKLAKSIVVVDDDHQVAAALKLQLDHFGYSTIISNDIGELPGLLEHEQPAALILDISFPGTPLAGVVAAKSLQQQGKLTCPLIFISARNDLEVRLEAIRADADAYFPKPIDLTEMLQSLDLLINPEEEDPYRVIVVDDDLDVATFNAAALNEAGIVTVVVTDPLKVMPPIRELRPDLILMDIQMPGCTGFELARSIRFDKTYVQTPIVFLTGSDIADTWLKFIKSGGDELLRKTIPTRELVATIHARCKRSRQLQTAMNSLKLSEARFKSVAQTAQEAIVTADGDGRIVFWNPAAENLFGYSRDEIISHKVSVLFADKDHSGLSDSWSGIIESVVVGQGAKIVPVEISTSEWKVNNSSFVTYIFRDITERKETQDQLIRARDDAENANRAKSEFLSAMSHDLRTPLNSIIGFVDLLLMDERSPLNEDQTESLSFVKSGGSHLLELINQVLDLSAVEAGTISLDSEPVVVNELVKICIDLIAISANDREITIEHSQDHSTVAVFADRQRLQEVLLNLLSNAVKYNSVGGRISIDCQVGENGQVRTVVADQGPGIAPENLDRLFVAFDRLDAAGTDIEGTGIGLTIVKRFVERMGGTVGVSSVVGEGTRFWIDLPQAGKEKSDTPAGREEADLLLVTPAELQEETQHTILCIEDNLANMRLLQRILATKPGYSVIEARSGEDGLEIAASQRPDIILMDIGLPGMDGFETLSNLQSMSTCQDIPVIALSANAMKHDVDKGQEAGFFEYLTKPVVINELLDAINRAIKKTGSTSPE